MRSIRQLLLMITIVIVVGFAWVLLNDRVDALWNLRLAYIAMYATVLSGMVLLVGHSGQVSLGHGAFMAVGGYTFALALTRGWSLPIAFVAVVVAGIVFGLGVGVVAARLSGPYLAGLTLGLAVGLPALANRFPELLGGDSGLLLDGPYPPDSFGMDFPLERWQSWIAGAVGIVAFTMIAALITSPAGRAIRAVRDHEVAAALAGVDRSRTKIAAFAVSAVCAALAGAVLTTILGLAAPGAFGIGLSLSLLVGVVVGGRQSLVGAGIGALLLALLPELLGNAVSGLALPERIAVNLAGLVYGLLLLLTVGLAPAGVAGLLRRVGRNRLPQ
jgi:branched-chain amino acid transport system permease protein